MKKTIALLFAAAGLLSVPAAQATPYDSTDASVTPAHVKDSKSKPKQSVYYITSVQATGSHLPLVVARYDGHYHSQSPISVYGKPNLDRTGQLGVAGELNQRDPAITVGHR